MTNKPHARRIIIALYFTLVLLFSYQSLSAATPDELVSIVRINAVCTPNIIGDTVVCVPDSGSIYFTPFIASATYTWQVLGGTLTAGQGTDSITVDWLVAGLHQVIVTHSDTGCSVSDTLNVIAFASPSVSVIGDSALCDTMTNILYYSNLDTTNFLHVWSLIGGAIDTGQGTDSILVNWLSQGFHTVSVQVTDTNGCTAQDSLPVQVGNTPAPSISGQDTVCAFQNLVSYSSILYASHTYNWTVEGGTYIGGGLGQSTITVFWDSAGTGKVILHEIAGPGCEAHDTLFVEIKSTPIPGLSGPDVMCGDFNAKVYTTDTTVNNFFWFIGGGTITAGQFTPTVTVNWTAIGAGGIGVLETSTNGCSAIDTIVVCLANKPTPLISGQDSVCEFNQYSYNMTTPDTLSTYTWNPVGGTVTSGQGTSNVLIKWGASGSTQLIVYEENCTGCDSSDTLNIVIRNSPTPAISGDTIICKDYTGYVYTTPLDASNGYFWQINGGTIQSGQGSNTVTVDWTMIPHSGWILVTEFDPTLCQITDTLYIETFSPPNPGLSGEDSVCTLTNGWLYTANNISGATYNWNITGGILQSGQGTDSITVDWLTPGQGVVSLLLTTGTLCDSLDSLIVTILPIPSPSISGDTNICDNLIGHTYTTPLVSGNTYSWQVSGGTIQSGQGTNSVNIDFSSAPSTAEIIVTENNTGNCPVSDTFQVNLFASPTPSISGADTVCENDTAINYSTILDASHSYLWAVSGGSISSGQGSNSITVNWGTAGSGMVTLLETSGPGCFVNDTLNVTVFAIPSPSIIGDTSACGTYLNQVYGTISVPGNTYTWVVNGGNITSGQGTSSILVDWTIIPGPNRVIVTETNPATCGTSDTMNVNVYDLASPSITGLDTVCENVISISYAVGASGVHSFNWQVGGGVIASGQGTNIITVNWGAAGTGFVKITMTSGPSCSATDSLPVLILPIPGPNITGDTSLCGDFLSKVYSTTSVSGNNYNWNVSGGNIISGQGTSSITVDWTSAPGTGTVSVTETNAASCGVSDTMNVSLYITPTPSISGQSPVCKSASGVSYTTALVAANTYIWVVNGGTISSGQGTNTITVNWGTGLGGSVIVSESSGPGCAVSDTLSLTIHNIPSPSISGSTVLCSNLNGIAYSTSNVPGNTFLWNVVGGNIASGQGTNAITVNWTAAPGTGEVQVTENNAGNCPVSDTVQVDLNVLPTPSISGPDTVCKNVTNQTYATNTVSGNTYSWQVTGGTISSGQGTAAIIIDWGSGSSGQVIVTETSGPACVAIDTFNVTILPIPSPIIVGDTSLCSNFSGIGYTSAFVLNNTYTWSVVGGNIASGQGTNSIVVNWTSTPGSGTVILQEGNPGGCFANDTATVSLNLLPSPAISGPDTVCENVLNQTYTTASVLGNTYNWTVTGGTISSGQGSATIVVNWGAVGSGQVIVTESSGFQCSASDTFAVVILVTPSPSIVGDTSLCSNFTSIGYTSAFVLNNTYSWTVTGGNITAGQGTNSIVVNWTVAPGTGTVILQEGNPGGCFANDTVTVALNILPNPAISGPDTVCENVLNQTYATASVSGNTYSWQVNGGTIQTGQGSATITVDWGATGSGQVIVTESSGFMCNVSDTFAVVILVTPSPLIVGDTTLCSNFGGIIYSSAFVLNNTYSWTVNGGMIAAGQGTNSIIVNWTTAPGIGTVILQEGNPGGCSATDTISVSLNFLPSPTISGPDTVCANVLTQTYATASVSGNSYNWLVNGGTIQSGQGSATLIVDWGTSGSGQVIVTESSGFMCTVSDTFNVNIQPSPNPVMSGPDTVCNFASNVNYSTSFNGGNTYSWSISGGTITSGSGTNMVVVDWGVAGSGSISVIEDNGTCSKTSNVNVVILGSPVTSISGSDTICSGDTTSYNTSMNVGYTYTWQVTGGTISSGQGTNMISVIWGTALTGQVIVNESFGVGCSADDTTNVSIMTLPTPAIIGPDSVCDSAMNITYTTMNNAGNNYSWTTSGGVISSGQGTSIIVVNWGAAGGGMVQVVETNGGGCTGMDTKNVTIVSPPNNTINIASPICQGQTGVSVSVTSTVGHTYNWLVSGGTITSGQGTANIMVDFGMAPSSVINLTETNTIGCVGTDSVMLSLQSAPVASFGSSNVGMSFTFTDSSINMPTSWYWTFGDGDTSVVQYPMHTYATSGTYEVCLIATNNCGVDTICDSMDVLLAISPGMFREEVQLYPNPNNGIFTLSGSLNQPGELKIEVVAISGKLLFTREIITFDHFQEHIDVSYLAQGVYVIRLLSVEGQWSRRFVLGE